MHSLKLYEGMKDGQQRHKIFIGKKKTGGGCPGPLGGIRTSCQSLILTPRLSDKILNGGGLMGHFGPAPNYLLMSARATGE